MFIKLTDGSVYETNTIITESSDTGYDLLFTAKHDNDDRVVDIKRVVSISKIHPNA